MRINDGVMVLTTSPQGLEIFALDFEAIDHEPIPTDASSAYLALGLIALLSGSDELPEDYDCGNPLCPVHGDVAKKLKEFLETPCGDELCEVHGTRPKSILDFNRRDWRQPVS